MREAVGGTLLLKIVLVFLVVYIGFMAIILNYGKTFRIKNKLINFIEQSEGLAKVEDLENEAKRLSYNLSSAGSDDWLRVCYYSTAKGYYYRLSVYIRFNLPLVNNKLLIPITGETRLIDTGTVVPIDVPECKE